MSELKTLKDFYHETININEHYKEGHRIVITDAVNINLLKQEAINDIKELQKQWLEHAEAKINGLVIPYSKPLIDYIKWKNNITEEDLK